MRLITRITKNLSTTKRKILKNLLWAVVGKLISLFGTLLVGILIARYLGPKQYGLMNYVISYVSIFTVLSNFGLDNIEIRELANNEKEKNQILGTSFGLRLILSLITFVLIVISVFIFDIDAESRVLIIIYSCCIFPSTLYLIRNYFTSIVLNEYVVKSEIVRSLIGAIIKIILLWIKAPLSIILMAMTFDFVLLSGGYLFSYKKYVGNIKDWSFDLSYAKYLLKESFPLVLSGAAVIIYQKIDQVMLSEMIDNVAVGYYATAGQFIAIIMFVPITLVQTITPILVRLRNENLQSYEDKKLQFLGVITWSSIFIAAFVSLVASPVICYTFGEQYMPAVPILQIVIWKTVGMALSASSGQIIILEGIQKWASIRNFMSCALCICMNYLFIPKYGVIGAAYASVLTLIAAAYIFNIFIPPYQNLMKIQTKAIILGWKYSLDYVRKK